MKVREKADDMFLQALGNRIASIRKEKHITQVELSYRCDIEKTNMRRIEAGNTNPTVLMLKKIALGLGISLAELLDFTTP
ncbi:helix-turn-helix domain-containing protein [Mucilaginibacter sp. BJC16-A38]|uniref:helix-turn-helix domain-containing protein n=1 Tax=Mucilaginibacter phenanthrenivorans TaxID=1234842 RepID=UPI0021588F24|nr:helix-turn-helix transcriptional regulator [Mucilaginibacter phenanthrenivorans]MCR8559278.1 helix-turn-helix domain-containing protein [Mucilaginibacter phenanthrenivorans]